MTARIAPHEPRSPGEAPGANVDPGTRAQVAEFLRMTPSERLRSLQNTVEFIERARQSMRRARR